MLTPRVPSLNARALLAARSGISAASLGSSIVSAMTAAAAAAASASATGSSAENASPSRMLIEDEPYAGSSFVIQRKEIDRKVSFVHWQLKDLLSCSDSDPGELYYVYRTAVYHYNCRTKQEREVMHLDYHPTSMCQGFGYVCTVGQEAELNVKNVLTETDVYSGQTGVSISNSCKLHRYADDDIRLIISSNDQKIKVYHLPSMECLAQLSVSTQVNFSDVSPNGKLLAAVGDNHVTYLFKMNHRQYFLIQELRVYEDCCFSCCFTPCGTSLLVLAQNGKLVVIELETYKTRSLNAFTRPGTSPLFSAAKFCRVVKCSPGARFQEVARRGSSVEGVGGSGVRSLTLGVELAAFTESTSLIHIVDLRNLAHHQVYRVAPENEESDICGLAFSCDGQFLFIALQDCIIQLVIDLAQRRCNPFAQIL